MSGESVFIDIGISFGLGFLAGLQRESHRSRVAGIRTFPLVCVFGTLCALISREQRAWLLVAGLVSIAALSILGNLILLKTEDPPDPGLTTEVALVLMFLVGAMLAFDQREAAIVVGGVVALTLHLKGSLHSFTSRLSEDDVRAVMRFALLCLVILPILPDRTYGPYLVWNPRQIWWMVVLIVGIGLGGYLSFKFLGDRVGNTLAGVLGGLVSSTATTITYAGRARSTGAEAKAALVIVVASTMSVLRVFLEIGIVAPELLGAAVPLLLFVFFPLAVFSVWYAFFSRPSGGERPTPKNPSEIRTAIGFAVLYAGILVGTAAAKDQLGQQGLMALAAISGMTDVDAMTLSTARMFRLGQLSRQDAARIVLIATMSNLVVKGLVAAFLGRKKLAMRIVAPFGAALLGGLAALVW